jgi:probable rRNA maturation factor
MRRTQLPARKRLQRALQLEVVDRGRPRSSRAFVAGVVRATLAFADAGHKPVSLLLTGDAGIAALHEQHLGDPSPTDVMSFDVDGTAEIVVNVEMARRVAREHGHAVRAEVALYIVHGLLHTLGYDDTSKRVRTRMRAAERAVLHRLALRVADVDA